MCRELLTAGRPWSCEFIAGILIRFDKEVSSSVGNADASKVSVLGSSALPQVGQSPSSGRMNSRCVGHTYLVFLADGRLYVISAEGEIEFCGKA